MAESKRTLQVGRGSVYLREIFYRNGRGEKVIVAKLPGHEWDAKEVAEVETFARRFAAANRMLAALEMLVDDPGLTASANEVIKSAIAAAKGA